MKIMEGSMKRIISIVAMVGCLGGVLSAANFGIGLSGSDEGIDSFSLSIGNYYGVPVREVQEVEYYVPREQMSVVYYLANKSHRNARYITDLREQGMSWWNISLHLGLDPYTIYRDRGSKGRHHRLHDSEIADYVNVRFISDYHHINRDEVINRRHKGEQYYHINDSYYKKQERPQYREEKKVHNERQVQHERKEDRREVKDNRRDDKKSKNDKNDNSDKKNKDSHER